MNFINQNQEKESKGLTNIYYIIFGVESLATSLLFVYLIMSNFNKKTLRETLKSGDKILIYLLLVIILTGGMTFADIYVTNNYFLEDSIQQQNNIMNDTNFTNMNGNNDGTSVATAGSIEVENTEELSNETYSTSTSDESVILVKDGGELTLTDAVVEKTGGDSSNIENSEFYGVNSGILVTEDSTATIKGATISTNAKGSNAVFSTGSNSKIYISDSTITTSGSSSARGLDSTYGGYIEADNVTITTQGGSCATLATDRGEGTVIAKNSKLETNGSGSPIIYSTGEISISNTTGVANGSQMVVIEGKNSATVENSSLEANAKGNRGDVDQAGVMIYQSMSGDANVGTGNFTATDSNLTISSSSDYYQTAPMFFITNTDAIINLTNTKLEFGSNILISAKGTTEWGTTGANGGNVTLNADNQELEGNIEIDNISTLQMNLQNSNYAGIINGNNNAKSIKLKLDSSSTITLTGDCYVTALEDEDVTYRNINFNGYKLYINGTAIN